MHRALRASGLWESFTQIKEALLSPPRVVEGTDELRDADAADGGTERESESPRELGPARGRMQEQRAMGLIGVWIEDVLPNWEQERYKPRTCRLWRRGIPWVLRSRVWSLVIGNRLGLNVGRFQSLLKSKAVRKAEGIRGIRDIGQDLPRTHFEGKRPDQESLQQVLEATAAQHPHIGYVQGMSHLAAMLMVYMSKVDAFICLANLITISHLKLFLTPDPHRITEINRRSVVHDELLKIQLPHLAAHFHAIGYSSELHLVDWWFTCFSKNVNLRLASRIWDCYIFESEPFLFRVAIGILKFFEAELLQLGREECYYLLTHLSTQLQQRQSQIAEQQFDEEEYTGIESQLIDCIFSVDIADRHVLELLHTRN